MIRLTVLYNLADGADPEAYVTWRLTSHADYIRTMPDVERANFGRIIDQWPDHATGHYAFQSTVEWPDRVTFERAFYDEQIQADLKENLKKLGNYKFIVSEVIAGA